MHVINNKQKIENNYQVRVRYAHTDKMGIVYNGNYALFFEIGRTELMRSYGLPYAQVEEWGFQLPLIDLYTKFIKPAKYDDVININTLLITESPAVIKFEYLLSVENQIVTTGYTRHVFIKTDGNKPVKPPQFFLDIVNSI